MTSNNTPYSRSKQNVNRISFLPLHNQPSEGRRIYRWERKDKQNYGASTEAWILDIVTQSNNTPSYMSEATGHVILGHL
jgi:hypothetical protein